MDKKSLFGAAIGVALALVAGSAALSQSKGIAAATAGALKAVFDCRTQPDAVRLACFDGTVAKLQAGFEAREVVVVDQQQARAARREAFGFKLPSLALFNGVAGGEEPAKVTFDIAEAARGPDDRWTIETVDGQVWRQVERSGGYMRVKPGAKAEIERGMLGAFFMKIDGGRAFKVSRER
jgi:hypothetical protein